MIRKRRETMTFVRAAVAASLQITLPEALSSLFQLVAGAPYTAGSIEAL